jgi:hypothetical protein
VQSEACVLVQANVWGAVLVQLAFTATKCPLGQSGRALSLRVPKQGMLSLALCVLPRR